MNNNTPAFSFCGFYNKFIEQIKNIFTHGVTDERVNEYVSSIDAIINKGIDDKLDEKISGSNVATKHDIELVKRDIGDIEHRLDHKIELLDQKVDKRITNMTIMIILSLGTIICISNWLIPHASK